jgi:hypothetical protein
MPGNFLTTDLDKILKVEELASMALYDSTLVLGVFDNEDIEVQMGDGTIRIINQCLFTAKSEDFPDIAEGEVIVISDVSYAIQSWSDDGTGMIEIQMEKL